MFLRIKKLLDELTVAVDAVRHVEEICAAAKVLTLFILSHTLIVGNITISLDSAFYQILSIAHFLKTPYLCTQNHRIWINVINCFWGFCCLALV